jgi:hypothetical protein
MVEIEGYKGQFLQDKRLLSEIKMHNWKLRHVDEREIKKPDLTGMVGRVVDKKMEKK